MKDVASQWWAYTEGAQRHKCHITLLPFDLIELPTGQAQSEARGQSQFLGQTAGCRRLGNGSGDTNERHRAEGV